VLVEFALLTGAMPGLLVRVRAANADPADPGVEVELPVAPGRWGSEHTERVANAVGIDTHSALVSLRFADGESEGLPAGRGGWRMIAAMEPGDVLVVGSGAAAATAPAPPAFPKTSPVMTDGTIDDVHTTTTAAADSTQRVRCARGGCGNEGDKRCAVCKQVCVCMYTCRACNVARSTLTCHFIHIWSRVHSSVQTTPLQPSAFHVITGVVLLS
jgi:hypothetical protein